MTYFSASFGSSFYRAMILAVAGWAVQAAPVHAQNAIQKNAIEVADRQCLSSGGAPAATREGACAKALVLLESAGVTDPNLLTQVHAKLADQMTAAGLHRGAVKHYDAAEKLLRDQAYDMPPEHRQAVGWLSLRKARSYYQLGEWEAGLRAISVADEYGTALQQSDASLLGNLMFKMPGFDEHLRLDFLVSKASSDSRRSVLNLARAVVFVAAEQADKATPYYEMAVRQQPSAFSNNAACWHLLARVRDPNRAKTYCEAAATLAPQSAANLDSLGLMYLQLGKFELADAHYSQALELAPALAHARYGRGIARQRLGRQAEAIKDRDAALAVDGGLERKFDQYLD